MHSGQYPLATDILSPWHKTLLSLSATLHMLPQPRSSNLRKHHSLWRWGPLSFKAAMELSASNLGLMQCHVHQQSCRQRPNPPASCNFNSWKFKVSSTYMKFFCLLPSTLAGSCVQLTEHVWLQQIRGLILMFDMTCSLSFAVLTTQVFLSLSLCKQAWSLQVRILCFLQNERKMAQSLLQDVVNHECLVSDYSEAVNLSFRQRNEWLAMLVYIPGVWKPQWTTWFTM